MKAGFAIELGPEWNTLQKKLNAWQGTLMASIERGTKKVALYLVQEITQRIFDRKYQPNSAVTLLLKELEGFGNTPLVRSGRLARMISRELLDSGTAVEVGLLLQAAAKGARGRDSRGKFTAGARFNIGEVLHNGATIPVTAAMRRAFARRIRALERRTGRKFPKSTGGKRTTIRIPPRPFIRDVFEDPAVLANIEDIYLRELEKGSGIVL